MSKKKIEKFGLVIIQSLRDGDKPTGATLSNELLKYKQFQEPELSCDFYNITTAEELLNTLKAVDIEIEESSFHPILHFEAHGSFDGIAVTSGEVVAWSDLLPIFRSMNIKMRNYLLICFGTCFGGSAISFIDPSERAPFRSIVATVKEVGENEVSAGFQAFYDHFFFSFEIIESLDKLNAVIGGDKPKFYHLSSEWCFDGICNPDRDPVAFSRMVNQTAVIEKSKNPAYSDIPFEDVVKEVDANVRQLFADTTAKRDYFLMTDLK